MELSDVAHQLWTRYKLPWQNDTHQANEWYAKFYAHGIINPFRRLEFVSEQGYNGVTSLKYLESGYGCGGGFGGISVHDAPRASGIGLYYEVAPAALKEFTDRLKRSGPTGEYLAGLKPYPQQEGTVLSGAVVTSLSIIEPFFVNFIECLPLSERAQQTK